MPAMFTRRLALPARSFLLLGPRGTGKTTWLRAQLPRARWYNLLLDRELLRLMRDPGTFRHEIEALPPSPTWARRGSCTIFSGGVITSGFIPLTLAAWGAEPATDDLLRFGGLP